MSETALTPANQNPWYVLMTLYGEQEGEDIDWGLHEKNLAAWNAWATQGMSDVEREKVVGSSAVQLAELNSWPSLRDQVAQLHEGEWQRRNGSEIVYPGVPVAGHVIELSSVDFDRHFVMRGAIFGGDVSFAHSGFNRVAQFRRATFVRTGWFASVRFNDAAWFGKTTFRGEVGFGNATFIKTAGFEHAIFSELVGFGEATFKEDANFSGVKFNGYAQFDASTFEKGVAFRRCAFGGEAEFGGSQFGESVEFNDTVFSGFAYFHAARFGSVEKDQVVKFIDCQFEKPANFTEAFFFATYPDFSGAILHERTSFSDQPDNWPKRPQGDLRRAKASCAAIRHNVGKQGLPEAEHFFFRREMGFAGQSAPILQRPLFWAFNWFSEYGYGILTPVMWLLSVIGLGAFVLGADLMGGPQEISYVQALGLSFSNVFNILGFQKTYFASDFMMNLPQELQFLSALETVAGVILLFFLGLGLRTRFRLR